MREAYYGFLSCAAEQDSVHHSTSAPASRAFTPTPSFHSVFVAANGAKGAQGQQVLSRFAPCCRSRCSGPNMGLFCSGKQEVIQRRQTSLLHMRPPQESRHLHLGVFTIIGVEAHVISSYLISGRAQQHLDSLLTWNPESSGPRIFVFSILTAPGSADPACST